MAQVLGRRVADDKAIFVDRQIWEHQHVLLKFQQPIFLRRVDPTHLVHKQVEFNLQASRVQQSASTSTKPPIRQTRSRNTKDFILSYWRREKSSVSTKWHQTSARNHPAKLGSLFPQALHESQENQPSDCGQKAFENKYTSSSQPSELYTQTRWHRGRDGTPSFQRHTKWASRSKEPHLRHHRTLRA